MNETTATEVTPGKSTNLKRVLVLVAIGLGSINIVQFVKSMAAERIAAQELREALDPRSTTDRFHTLFTMNPHGYLRRVQ